MQIVMRNIDELIPYKNNPRRNEQAVKYVAESIKQFGFKVPIILDGYGEIVAGHTRYEASKALGLSEIPCVIADDLTEDQIRAFRLVDNKVSEFADWDIEMLNAELDFINIDMSEFGFNEILNDIDIDDLWQETSDEHKEKTNMLHWVDKKVTLTDEDIEKLDNIYYKWKADDTSQTFIDYALDTIEQ